MYFPRIDNIAYDKRIIVEVWYHPHKPMIWCVVEKSEKVSFGYIKHDDRFAEWGFFDCDELKENSCHTPYIKTISFGIIKNVKRTKDRWY